MIANADTSHPYPFLSYASEGTVREHDRIKENLERIFLSLDESYFISGNAQPAIEELNAIAGRACQEDWDGNEGCPISIVSYHLSKQLLRNMPRNWPTPDVDLDSDGEVTLSWSAGPGNHASIVVNSSGKLSYAWMSPHPRTGIERNYGVSETDGVFPNTISEVISKFSA